MNSNDKDFDWHKPGVYCAVGPQGGSMLETMQATGHGSRASLLGHMNKRWSVLKEEGWVIQEYAPTKAPQVLDYAGQRMVIINTDMLFTIGKDEDIDAAFDTLNMLLIPLQAKEGGDPRFIDYAFNGEPAEHAGDVRQYNYDAGFTLIPTPTDVIKIGEQVATSTAERWRYPANGEAAPAHVTVQLLTRGGVVVRGMWNDLGDYIAWAPMIKRDKELEARLGL